MYVYETVNRNYDSFTKERSWELTTEHWLYGNIKTQNRVHFKIKLCKWIQQAEAIEIEE